MPSQLTVKPFNNFLDTFAAQATIESGSNVILSFFGNGKLNAPATKIAGAFKLFAAIGAAM